MVMSAASAALGGHDDGDPVQRQPGRRLADRAGITAGGQAGQPGRVAGAGHLGGQPLGRGRGQQPADARADHIGADQRQQPGSDDPAVPGGGRGHRSRPPPDRERSPVSPAILAGAAGLPSLLPGRTWLGLEPAQHDADPAAPVLLTSPAGHARYGAAASSPSRSARASRVRGQASRSGRGGNRRRSASAWASGGPLPGRGGAAAVSGPGPALTTGPARTAHSATRPGSPQRPAAMGWPAARRAADGRPARRR